MARCAVPVAERSVRRWNRIALDGHLAPFVPPAIARAGTAQRAIPTTAKQQMHVGALLGRPSLRRAFSLIEIMMVVALLTLIMVALMSVFSSTQTAFRASITQTDVLEGSRAAMDLLTSDLRQMAPPVVTTPRFPWRKCRPSRCR